MQTYEIFLIVLEISRFLLKNGQDDNFLTVIERQKDPKTSVVGSIPDFLDIQRCEVGSINTINTERAYCDSRGPEMHISSNGTIWLLEIISRDKIESLILQSIMVYLWKILAPNRGEFKKRKKRVCLVLDSSYDSKSVVLSDYG